MQRPFAILALFLSAATTVCADDRPNVIVILADDMGFSDIAPYGGEIDTPVLSRLANDGLRFTQFYNGARCCPTRASLLTGLYPHQTGVGWMMVDQNLPGYRGDLNDQCLTIAEAMQTAGYSAYASGKWHVTLHATPEGPKHNWPLQRGFDRYYGILGGAASFFDPATLTRDNEMISAFADPEYPAEDYYLTDAISAHAERFIREHATSDATKDQPFFLYVAYTAAHWPMHAPPEEIEKYRGKYDAGYGPIREARLKRLQEMGLIQKEWRLTQQAEDWSQVKDKAWEARCMEVYAAMIDRMDQGIGRIVRELEEQRQLDNTLILYLQDNGACAEDIGRKPTTIATESPPPLPPEALQMESRPTHMRDGTPVRRGPGVMPGAADTYLAYGRGWANVSNTPFREYKRWVHEGGISTPLIAHWPARIQRRGELEHQPGHLIDIMATCLDVAKAKFPLEHEGEPLTPLEGVSLTPAFAGQNVHRSSPLCWEHEGNLAIRAGDWKMVAKDGEHWELYNVAMDRTETHNLFNSRSEIALKLWREWEDWSKRAQVQPVGAWKTRRNIPAETGAPSQPSPMTTSPTTAP